MGSPELLKRRRVDADKAAAKTSRKALAPWAYLAREMQVK